VMRSRANLLFRAAGVVWLATLATDVPSERACADEAPAKMVQGLAQQLLDRARALVQDDAVVQQFEQQFGPQFRQLYKTELHFMRLVTRPTKQQFEKIAAEGEAGLKGVIRRFARNGAAYSAGEQADPRTLIADALLQPVRTTLSPEQAARYQKELEQRAAARKRVVLLDLVAKIDKVLALTTEQRAQISTILENNWDDSWDHIQFLMYGGQYFPRMPEAKIDPLLTETQKAVWRDIPKGNVRFGLNLQVMLQGFEAGDEVWDDDQPAEKK